MFVVSEHPLQIKTHRRGSEITLRLIKQTDVTCQDIGTSPVKKFTQVNNKKGKYSITKVKRATVNTEPVFLLTAAEEALHVIINVTVNKHRETKLVPILNNKVFIFTNGSMKKMKALCTEKTNTRMTSMK